MFVQGLAGTAGKGLAETIKASWTATARQGLAATRGTTQITKLPGRSIYNFELRATGDGPEVQVE
jgi:hypothetical protein